MNKTNRSTPDLHSVAAMRFLQEWLRLLPLGRLPLHHCHLLVVSLVSIIVPSVTVNTFIPLPVVAIRRVRLGPRNRH